ncbi:putative nucleotidyltransferase [Thioalkalivibrio sp. ALE21]|uniref:nucleotidyltransferase family protein n=1 Tax=Thioalkalivibrio sp. ALE21 TaxID=1158175 RepID=UPI000D8D5F9D|nr:nucleotidyltransferase domain-containing protein [Thioalkalivibrio sp. ALE21]PYG00784.1 putative nucleotidyltransferase [Thioalkalivibrio sp. ALE21]
MVDLAPAQREVVERLVRRHLPAGTRVWIFGSRATGSSAPASDLDLLVDAGEALDFAILGELEADLAESDLPFPVDVVDAHRISEAFAARIRAECVPLPEVGELG